MYQKNHKRYKCALIMNNIFKVGDLVKFRYAFDAHEKRLRGIVIDIANSPTKDDALLIHWSENYGQYWTREPRLEKAGL